MSTESDAAAERTGQTLKDRYRIERLLHVDSAVAVYAGRDLKAGRVAIRLLSVERSSDAAARTQWIHRAYLANAVGHAGAVSVLDDGMTADGAAFVVTELFEASSLAQLLLSERGGRLPARLACAIADQCLDVLACAHDQHVVHGAISARKLFWTRSGQLKVLGFGSTSSRQDFKQDVQRDLRGAACTLLEVLLGRPVAETNVPEALAALRTLTVSVPEGIHHVVERAFTSDLARSWSSAQQMRAGLRRAFLQAFGSGIEQALRPLAAAQQPAPPAWVWLTAAVAGAALVVWTASWPIAPEPDARPSAHHDANHANHANGANDTTVSTTSTSLSASTDPTRADSPESTSEGQPGDGSIRGAPATDAAVTPPQHSPPATEPADPVERHTRRLRGPASSDLRLHARPTARRLAHAEPHRMVGREIRRMAGDPRLSSAAPAERLCAQLRDRPLEGRSAEATELWSRHCAGAP